LYKDAIVKVNLLKGRDMRFYSDYLSSFEPMSIKSGTVFCREGASSLEVFFLLKGCVEIVGHNKYYLEGTVFGEADIIMKGRARLASYKARGDCYMLKLAKNTFL
jgi:CRP-like cAMP-binding protein